MGMLTTRARMKRIEVAMNGLFCERSAPIRGLMVASVARANVFLLGPPGTAKTALVDTFASCIRHDDGEPARIFSRLIGRTTGIDELMGPVDMSSYREQGIWRRNVDRSLVDCDVAVLDEIFKGSSAILNGLLGVLNERRFQNGPDAIDCPMRLCVGMSNEIPQCDSLGALFDRFPLRYYVDHVSDRDEVAKIAFGSTVSPSSRIASIPDATVTPSELSEACVAASLVTIPESVQSQMMSVREDLAGSGVSISVRRLKTSASMVRAHAWLLGRDIAASEDVSILRDVFWDTPKDIDKVQRSVDQYAPIKDEAQASSAIDIFSASAALTDASFDRTTIIGLIDRGREIDAMLSAMPYTRARHDMSERLESSMVRLRGFVFLK